MESAYDLLPDNEPLKLKKLKRDIEAEALKRLEEAAKAKGDKEDFEYIVKQYDRLDANRERRERYHEILRGNNIPIEYGAAKSSAFNRNFMKLAAKGNFIDIIYDRPQEIEQFVTERYMYEILKNLKPEQKELLYYIAVLNLTNRQIADIRGQTERNVRKVKNTMMNKIRKQAYEYLTSSKATKHKLTLIERDFIRRYEEKLGIDKMNVE